MSVTPEELLAAAKNVESIAALEADYRSSISRYYYAGYHASIRFHGKLSSPGHSKANCGEHENLIHKLSNPTVSKSTPEYNLSKEVSQYLKGALFNRRLADYQLDKSVNKKNVEIVESHVSLIFNPN